MKTKLLLLIIVLNGAYLVQAQSTLPQKMEDGKWKSTFSNHASEDSSSDQEDSPLMMFRGEEEKSKTADARAQKNRDTRETTSVDGSNDEENTLTLDHFRTALVANPSAERLIILEDEDSGISIQPRAAGTSRLALKKNQLENEMIIEELRTLLAAKHGEEIADSFFEGMSNLENTSLSAEQLREILQRSDAPLHSLQKTPISNRSDSKATSPFGDSNIHEKLGADIRGNIETIAKVDVAKNLLGRKEKAAADLKKARKALRQKTEQRKDQIIVSSDTDGYSSLSSVNSTWLRKTVVKTAQLQAAGTLLEEVAALPILKEKEVAMRLIEEESAIAGQFRANAKTADLAAQSARYAQGEMNSEEVEKIYTVAKKSWDETLRAYEKVLETSSKAGIDTKEALINRDYASLCFNCWDGAILELKANRLDQVATKDLSSSLRSCTTYYTVEEITHASTAESAWEAASKAYQEALQKAAEKKIKLNDWEVSKIRAEERSNYWKETLLRMKAAGIFEEKMQEAVQQRIEDWKAAVVRQLPNITPEMADPFLKELLEIPCTKIEVEKKITKCEQMSAQFASKRNRSSDSSTRYNYDNASEAWSHARKALVEIPSWLDKKIVVLKRAFQLVERGKLERARPLRLLATCYEDSIKSALALSDEYIRSGSRKIYIPENGFQSALVELFLNKESEICKHIVTSSKTPSSLVELRRFAFLQCETLIRHFQRPYKIQRNYSAHYTSSATYSDGDKCYLGRTFKSNINYLSAHGDYTPVLFYIAGEKLASAVNHLESAAQAHQAAIMFKDNEELEALWGTLSKQQECCAEQNRSAVNGIVTLQEGMIRRFTVPLFIDHWDRKEPRFELIQDSYYHDKALLTLSNNLVQQHNLIDRITLFNNAGKQMLGESCKRVAQEFERILWRQLAICEAFAQGLDVVGLHIQGTIQAIEEELAKKREGLLKQAP